MTKNTASQSRTDTGGKGCEGAYRNLAVQFEKVWREAVRTTAGGMSKQSHFRYRDSMTGFLRFCAEKFHLEKLANVRSKHLQAYVDYRRQVGISEKTLKNDLAAIRFFTSLPGRATCCRITGHWGSKDASRAARTGPGRRKRAD